MILRSQPDKHFGRLLAIYQYGGFYIDVDCKINKPFEQNIKSDSCVLFVEKHLEDTTSLGKRENKSPERVLRIANCVFGTASPKHSFIKDVIEECIKRLVLFLDEKNENMKESDVLWLAGPDVITSVYHDKRLNYSNVILLDESYTTHAAVGSWRFGKK